MKEKDFKSSVEKMLLKKAMGFKVKENVDEYASVGEEMKLVKRRITTKYVSPDLAAAKTLLELNGREEQNDLSYLSDEQLLRERTRLLLALESASGAPCSATTPSDSTTILSAPATVRIRWAMIRTVLCFMSRESAS